MHREINCGYHYKPKQYFEAHKPLVDLNAEPAYRTGRFSYTIKKTKTKPDIIKEKVSAIPAEVFKQSLKLYNENNFAQFLTKHFGYEITSNVVSKYFIGTSKHWNGASVFWQIDSAGKIRTGKIMLYNADTGKRVKEPYNHINWVHSALKLPEFGVQQCFFGEHLINQDFFKPIAIAESEKIAIIASVYLPQFIWLACGQLQGLPVDKCKILKGRKVVLFPDLKAFVKWKVKAKQLSGIAHITVSDLLEKKAPEADKQEGYDLADYLLKFPVQAFQIEPKEDIQLNAMKLFP